MNTADMLKCVKEDLGNAYRPDLSKVGSVERTLDEIPISEFTKIRRSRARRKPDPSARKNVVPKSCRRNVDQKRLAEIYKELRTVRLDDDHNALAVLLHVFLESSVDHFLEKHSIPLSFLA